MRPHELLCAVRISKQRVIVAAIAQHCGCDRCAVAEAGYVVRYQAWRVLC